MTVRAVGDIKVYCVFPDLGAPQAFESLRWSRSAWRGEESGLSDSMAHAESRNAMNSAKSDKVRISTWDVLRPNETEMNFALTEDEV